MNILLVGYGAMNKRVAALAEERGHTIVGVLTTKDKIYPYDTFKMDQQWPDTDVIIDFSHPELSLSMLEKNKDIPVVMATTGKKDQILAELNKVSNQYPVFFSANMSYGVHILTEIIKYAVPLLPQFDIELIEKHHRRKIDAPSGTLIKLHDAIKESRNVHPVYDRTRQEQQRTDDEIGISVVRGGTIVGEHEVIFAGHDETIQIIHRAQSKDIFAAGSIDVAERLVHKENGYYTFDNL